MRVHLFKLALSSALLFLGEISCSVWDSIPIVSQVKSAVQAIGGDSNGARQTQENFSRGFPLVAPVRAVVEHASGNHEEAKKTWSYLGKNYEGWVDGTPGLGHIKGGIHYAIGDTQRGDEIMKAATRPIGVLAGGVAGAIVAGPVGAAVGGIAGGAAMDGVITGVESAINKEYVPHGYVSTATKLVKNEASQGEYQDAIDGLLDTLLDIAGTALDDVAG